MSEIQKLRKLVYATLTIDLGTAHTDTEYVLPGIFDTIIVLNLSPLATSAYIRLNERTRDLLDLTQLRVINASAIDRIFMTNTVQAGLTLTLAFGADSSFGVGGINQFVYLRDGNNPSYVATILNTGQAYGNSYGLITNAIQMVYDSNLGIPYQAVRTPNVFKSALISANGSTAIWTSGVGKKWHLMGMQITLVNGTTAAAACLLKILDVAADTGLGVQICGAALGAVGTSSIIFNSAWGNGIVAAATNTALNVNLSSVLAVAGVFVQVWGYEE